MQDTGHERNNLVVKDMALDTNFSQTHNLSISLYTTKLFSISGSLPFVSFSEFSVDVCTIIYRMGSLRQNYLCLSNIS